ncbi:MAG: DNA-binding protein [Bacteroidaceae bacterium]|nr:DNA-binding protein [Bacteroidaceae bacterium]
MKKDLTTSEIDRQNVLNNRFALEEVQRVIGLKGIIFEKEYKFTKHQVASFFDVTDRAISNCLKSNENELRKNGYDVLKGNRLKMFKLSAAKADVWEVNFLNKTPQLGVFNYRSFINLAMLLSKSDRAREVRSIILDIVLDTINKRTGGNTKYINQRDEDFIFNLLQNKDYHRELVIALRDCVNLGKIKFIIYNDKIYKTVFREDADEYRKILRLGSEDDERNTMYSEVLDIIASIETGFADVLRKEYEKKGRQLSQQEADDLYVNFEKQRLWVPLINKARQKMVSRDLCFRDALHEKLSDYIGAVSSEDFDRFIGEKSMELSERLETYIEALKRLKDRK